MVDARSFLLVVAALAGASGCAAQGQAWVHESPHGGVASADAREVADCRAPQLPAEEEEAPFERPKTISLGMSYVEDGMGRLVIPSGEDRSLFEREAYRSMYGLGYGGYGYGYGYGRYLPPYPGSGGSRPEQRPPRDTRVPDYGPPMMDKTLPAPVWR